MPVSVPVLEWESASLTESVPLPVPVWPQELFQSFAPFIWPFVCNFAKMLATLCPDGSRESWGSHA